MVQKRHHTRLFANNHKDRSSMDKSGNILPGNQWFIPLILCFRCVSNHIFILKKWYLSDILFHQLTSALKFEDVSKILPCQVVKNLATLLRYSQIFFWGGKLQYVVFITLFWWLLACCMKTGTVVDSKICHPTEFDFYLCSHAGIQVRILW